MCLQLRPAGTLTVVQHHTAPHIPFKRESGTQPRHNSRAPCTATTPGCVLAVPPGGAAFALTLGAADPVPTLLARSHVAGPPAAQWVEFLCFDINVHVPHHVMSKIPWYNLRAATDSLRQVRPKPGSHCCAAAGCQLGAGLVTPVSRCIHAHAAFALGGHPCRTGATT